MTSSEFSQPWSEPVKRINTPKSLPFFSKSKAFQNLHEALLYHIEKIRGVECSTGSFPSEPKDKDSSPATLKLPSPSSEDSNQNQSEKVINLLRELSQWIDEIPPLKESRRYGNLSSRKWHKRLELSIHDLLLATFNSMSSSIIQTKPESFINEAEYYFMNSFGSKIRLDYGTGHELSFLAFMGALIKYNFISDISGPELLKIWCYYYDVVRKLITVYTLEPAGSHGVWGLDDHFHLIYIFGAAQFNNSANTVPQISSILDNSVVSQYEFKNLYINGISFIQKIKKGAFSEHSPILYDVTKTVKLWSKVLNGMIKMYEVEVLNKFPVVQHFYFGNHLYPWTDEKGELLPLFEPENEPVPKVPVVPTKVTLPGSVSGRVTGVPWRSNNTPHVNGRLCQSGQIENGLNILKR